MTAKLNLTSLIKYFSDKDPVIAANLTKLAESKMCEECEKAECECEKCPDCGDLKCSCDKMTAEAKAKVSKIAQVLVSIADELDSVDPELANEADNLLKEISASPMSMMMAPSYLMAPEAEEMGMEEDLPLEDEMPEPTPEFDEVGIDDFKNSIDNMKFRLTDAPKRDVRTKAHEMAEKGLKHLNHGRELIERAHKMLDEGGDKIRFKTDFKW